ncbi:f7ce6e87-ce21-4f39-a977-afb9dc6a0e20 [Sclerotinia trifoliorum]|uniref:Carboxylic ester hydrolase n=1 Tax=Sclerotinia trifoliorum TaxID=28548 RepID=A0A8H2VVT2_9HELO|nr:f7ce6e87-ce21-4f39-a977-afb9dc6a0e20 [Sclerotinia trifoliorum]
MLLLSHFVLLLSAITVSSSPVESKRSRFDERQSTGTSSPTVDLGYSVYQGYYNATSRFNIFKGIRYAAPPVGKLRWQKPQSPAVNRSSTIQAKAYPPHCPQSADAPMPANYNFTRSGLGNEDCLFLSVWASPNATNLPVMVWIHGGGYGTGSGNNDFSELANTNSNAFILVAIQYRLGAFGFLSSSDLVRSGGVPNAGLYDMNFSFQWVQSHISKFGGDPSRVTIAGESAGGGGVMLQTMAFGGSLGTSLFNNGIVASPYLPMQYDYDGLKPEDSYEKFGNAVGCRSGNGSVFDCLVGTDTTALQNASAYVSANGDYGQWAFLPVTDGEFLVKRPSEQLLAGEVNGVRMLSGNNANEAPGFVPQHINTTTAFNTFTQSLFPLMSNSTLDRLHQTYSIPSTIPGPLFASAGNKGPTALNQSVFAIGQQQRANNLYAETTFVCPSYWSASAFPQSWKYEYSVPPSQHGNDLDAYYAVNRTYLGYGTLSPGFRTAVQKIWGRFIVYDDPTLPSDVITSIITLGNGTQTGDDISAAGTGKWPQWKTSGHEAYQMLKLNMTGGEATKVLWTSADGGVKFNVTENTGSGVKADLAIVDAYDWEGERGARCDFWARIGSEVPE